MEEKRYYANGFSYKFKKEKDGWWSIYRWNENTYKWDGILQAKDLEHCKNFAELCEPVPIPMERII